MYIINKIKIFLLHSELYSIILKLCFFIFILMTVSFTHFFPTPTLYAYAENEYIATGYSFLEEENILAARQQATAMAQKRVMEMAVQGLLPLHTVISKWADIEKNIFPLYNRYIKGFRILQEGVTASNLYEVSIVASLNIPSLEQDLQKMGLTKDLQDIVKIMVFLSESLPNGRIINWWDSRDDSDLFMPFDQSLERILNSDNFQVVYPQPFLTNTVEPSPTLSLSNALEIAAQANAPMILSGHAKVKRKRGLSTSLVTIEASISATVFDTYTGKIITKINESAVATGLDLDNISIQAISKVVQKVAQILDKRRDSISSPDTPLFRPVNIKVKNIQHHKDFLILKKKLANIVDDLQERRLKRGEAIFSSKWKGSLSDLAQAITEFDFSPLKVWVVDATKDDTITLSLETVPKPAIKKNIP